MIWGWLGLFVGLFLLGGAFSFRRQGKNWPTVLLLVIPGIAGVAVGIWRLWFFGEYGA